jgi:hypothetical protein
MIDKTQAYITFIALNGDMQRTARALEVSVQALEGIAKADCWAVKLRGVKKLSRDGLLEAEREVSRATGYVQAVRLRRIVDGALRALQEDVQERGYFLPFVTVGKDRMEIKFTALAELAKILDHLDTVASRCLCDTPADRKERPRSRGEENVADVMKRVLKGLEKQTNSLPAATDEEVREAIEREAPIEA